MNLSETNKTLKNKIIKFDVPGFPVRLMQAPAGGKWLKLQFAAAKNRTYVVRQDDVMRRALGGSFSGEGLDIGGRRGIVRRDGENAGFILSKARESMAECAAGLDVASQQDGATINDFYGIRPIDRLLKDPIAPDGAVETRKTAEGTFYTFKEYDTTSDSFVWHKACDPIGWFAEPAEEDGKRLNEQSEDGLNEFDRPDAAFPEIDD